MRALIVYESMYGNTRRVASALATGLRDRYEVELVAARDAPDKVHDVDLLVVGGPTHVHGLASSKSRRAAVQAGQDHGTAVDPDATAARGMRDWLRGLDAGTGVRAAAFDTRIDKPAWITGSAARGIARRLRARGCDVVSTASFLVEDAHGPLAHGEEERARTWAAGLSSGAPAHV
jgi:hypothetical protein